MNIRILVFLLSITSVFSFEVSGQDNINILTGKIRDQDGRSPIYGATILVQDKDNRIVASATSDVEGNFVVRSPLSGTTLRVSYTGYKGTGEVTIGTRRSFNLQMTSENNIIEDVVVSRSREVDDGTGFLLPKERQTAAIASINMTEMKEMQMASLDQGLQGRLPGVDIATVSGDPGAGMQIRVRGVNGLNAGSDPLIVVDGMPYDISIPSEFDFATSDDNAYGQLLNLAPSDIEDISVLKDAAATAQWGSAGANGVLVITTKRGEVSKPALTYTFKGSVSQQPSPIPMLNGDRYTTMLLESFYNAGRVFSTEPNARQFQYDPNDTYIYHNFSNNTDWIETITQLGYFQDHNMQIRGGGQRARYMASLGYFNQEGVTKGTATNRLTGRVNLDYVVSDRITFQSDVAYTHADNDMLYHTGARDVAYRKMPNQSPFEYDAYGNLTGNLFTPETTAQGSYSGTYNPLAMVERGFNNQLGDQLSTRFSLRYSLIPQILRLESTASLGLSNNKTKTFLPQDATGLRFTHENSNKASDADLDTYSLNTRTNLQFNPKLASDDHRLSFFASFLTSDNRQTIQGLGSTNTASRYLQDPTIPSRTLTGNASFTILERRSIGLLGQFNYQFKDKYTLAGVLRGDGNSRFGPGNRFGVFPSLSANWRIGQEPIVKKIKQIDDIKLRASWGRSGGAPGSDYSYINLYETYGSPYLDENGVYSSNMELTNLQWSITTQKNLGLDVELFNRKLIMGAELYHNRTTDNIMGVDIPSYHGFGSYTTNIGVSDSKGWELYFNYQVFTNKTWDLRVNFNMAHNVNMIIELPEIFPRENARSSLGNGLFYTYLQEGNPFGSFYGFRFDGVYKDREATIARDARGNKIVSPDGDDVYMRFNYPIVDYVFQPGDAKYEDINHDGVIDQNDIVYLGNSNPELSGGFGFSLGFQKRWRLNAHFNYRYGTDMINGTKMGTTNMLGYNNQSTAVLRRWRKEGDETDIPRALFGTGYNSLGSTRYVEDSSFLRLRSLTLRYDFTQDVLARLRIGNLGAFVTVENLFTLTRYTGQDPDVSVRLKGPFTTLVDNSMTPPLKTITLGLTARF